MRAARAYLFGAILAVSCGGRSARSDGTGADGTGTGGTGAGGTGTGGTGAGGTGTGGTGAGGTGKSAGSGGRAGDPADAAAGGSGLGGGAEAGSGPSGGEAGSATSCDGELTGDVLDPNEVYFVGIIPNITCGGRAVAHWRCPNTGVVGFGCYFHPNSTADEHANQIRPTDGRLLYSSYPPSEIREFACDDCPYAGTYPEITQDNDPIVPTDCELDTLGPLFRVAPSGRVLFHCSAGTWRDFDGNIIHVEPEGRSLFHLGYDDLALSLRVQSGATDGLGVEDLLTSEQRPVSCLPPGYVIAVRAEAPNRFLVAVRQSNGVADGDELWKVDALGLCTLVGQFPPPPADHIVGFRGQLDPGGALFEIASGPEVFEDVILRRDIAGSSEVVYTETTEPLIELHNSGLVTGP